MTSYRRSHDARLVVLFAVACAVLTIIQLAEEFWPLILLGAAGVLVWRRRPWRIVAAWAERTDLRRQVAKLEQDAARHDELLDELEAVAGRPVEAVIASYRHMQRIYKQAEASGPRGTEIGV